MVTVVNASRLALRASLGFEVLTGGSAPAWISAPILRTDGERTVTLSLANATADASLSDAAARLVPLGWTRLKEELEQRWVPGLAAGAPARRRSRRTSG